LSFVSVGIVGQNREVQGDKPIDNTQRYNPALSGRLSGHFIV
jgi:hypothetical protein